MNLDDAYHVERVLARGAGGLTELVTLGGAGPFVRKKVPLDIANQGVWAAISSLDCPRVPKVQATYSLPDLFVVIYDYVPGQTLQELVLAGGRFSANKAAKLAREICEAAGALHSCGVIHRDLSPRNVIVAADGAHLIDLGIARTHVDGASADTTFLGTHGFAAPEQYGFAQTDARSDVYAIGCLLGYMLTGKEPDAEDYAETLAGLETSGAAGNAASSGEACAAVTNGVGNSKAEGAVVARLASCVRKACEFEPSARYQSAAQMSEAIEDALRERDEVGAGPQNAPGTSNKPSRNGFGGTEEQTRRHFDRAEEQAGSDASGSNVSRSYTPSSDSSSSNVPSPGPANPAVPNLNQAASGASGPGASKKLVVTLAAALVVALIAAAALVLTRGQANNTSAAASITSTLSDSSASHDSGSDSSEADGSSSTSGQGSSGLSADELPLEIAESGWSITSDSYVNYVVGLRNTSEDTAVDLPVVSVAGYSSAGDVLFASELGAMVSAPNQTSYLADLTFLDNPSALDHVEFALQASSATKTRHISEPVTFEVSAPSAHSDDVAGTSFTGTVSVSGSESAISALAPYSSTIKVTVVLRDSSGAIVGGSSDFLTTLSAGTHPYSVTYLNAPSYATAEAYAQAW